MILLQKKVIKLCKANNLLSQYYHTKKHCIQKKGVFIIENVQNSEAQKEANIQLQADLQKNSNYTKQAEPQKRYCRYCGQTEHNI